MTIEPIACPFRRDAKKTAEACLFRFRTPIILVSKDVRDLDSRTRQKRSTRHVAAVRWHRVFGQKKVALPIIKMVLGCHMQQTAL